MQSDTKKKSILIATGLYPPEIGGPATHTVMMETFFPAHNYEVTVIKFSDVKQYPKFFKHLAFLCKVFKKGRSADIIFSQDTLSVGFPTVIAAKLLRTQCVVRVPGDYVWEQSVQRFGIKEGIDDFQTMTYGFKVETLRKLQSFVVRHATKVVTPSDYFKKLVSGWGADPSKIFRVYNGLDFTNFPVWDEKALSEKVILSAGRLVPWKGFDALIRMMKQLPDWRLAVVGSGPEYKRLETLAESEGVQERVNFVGRLEHKEVLKKYIESSVFVLNTKFESFSFQTAEAMAVGIPLIVTNVGSLTELVNHGKTGILVEPDDINGIQKSIQFYSAQPAIAKEYGEMSKKSAREKFSIQKIVTRLIEVIEN